MEEGVPGIVSGRETPYSLAAEILAVLMGSGDQGARSG